MPGIDDAQSLPCRPCADRHLRSPTRHDLDQGQQPVRLGRDSETPGWCMPLSGEVMPGRLKPLRGRAGALSALREVDAFEMRADPSPGA